MRLHKTLNIPKECQAKSVSVHSTLTGPARASGSSGVQAGPLQAGVNGDVELEPGGEASTQTQVKGPETPGSSRVSASLPHPFSIPSVEGPSFYDY